MPYRPCNRSSRTSPPLCVCGADEHMSHGTFFRCPHCPRLADISLQLHHFGAWRVYARHLYNLSACDFEAFAAALPNLQGHRLSSRERAPPLLSEMDHAQTYARAMIELRFELHESAQLP